MDHASTSAPNPDGIWVFGYGSLVHTPGFDYERRVEGYIRGFRRVFWQGSTDHRGTPRRPGRTVTLTEEPGATTWGAAFRLAGSPEEQAAALAYLEWREKEYDVRHCVDVYDSTGAVAVRQARVYIASPNKESNRNYLGPAPLQQIAVQIATSRGPSGPNCDYLFRLADVMRAMGADDPELYELEALVRTELAVREAAAAAVGAGAGVSEGASGSGSGEEDGEGAGRRDGGDGEEGAAEDEWEEEEHHRDFRLWHQRRQAAAAAAAAAAAEDAGAVQEEAAAGTGAVGDCEAQECGGVEGARVAVEVTASSGRSG
ncbi:hypothetical protein HYH03_007787 [Edaphochlamys debaryana]|uniref:glutathione-specific gamma-glutamylcyclotransferase n=1 Tax=Edaphochlamys debaryana TaxID=47281 RepID=A0A835Y4S9_9CHLO|nr:hypothetical protein HYH03_007787 [Edaphochlamys debaryana]|eukprot:KAG2494151.1 hypothetical protein HYH03_007787 [Edaphochlamys debaryana]